MTGRGVLLPIGDSEFSTWAAETWAAERADDDAPWTVWVFGQDYEYFRERLPTLPAHWRLGPVGETLNRIAEARKDILLNIDAHLLRPGDDRTAWDASDIGDRGPYAGTFGASLCRAWLMAEVLQSGGRHVFWIEDLGFARALWRIARKQGLSVGWRSPNGKPRLRETLEAIDDFLCDSHAKWEEQWNGFRTFLKHRAIMRAARRKPPPIAALRDCDVLLITWAHERSFSADRPKDADSYFGGLPQTLRNAGNRVGYFVHAMFWVRSFSEIAANCAAAADPTLILEDFLTIPALARAWIGSLRAPFPTFGRRFVVGGLDATPLARRYARNERGRWRSTYARLLSDVGKRLRAWGVAPKALIAPYEGQPWEKCLREGVRRSGLPTRVIGYQTSTFSPSYLSFYPSRAEIAFGRAPDRLWTVGAAYAALFRANGFPEDRLEVVGSFRYQQFIERQDRKSRPPRTPGQDLVVLCATSIDYEEALELVYKAAAAVQDKAGTRLLVNFHPVTHRMFRLRVQETVAALLGEEPKAIEYAEAGIQELLDRADVVVYNTSGAVFEALAAGLPALYVGRDWAIDYDKAPEAAAIRCRTIQELRRLLDETPSTQKPDDISAYLEPPAGAAFFRF